MIPAETLLNHLVSKDIIADYTSKNKMLASDNCIKINKPLLETN